jgi:hypothetical protein
VLHQQASNREIKSIYHRILEPMKMQQKIKNSRSQITMNKKEEQTQEIIHEARES